MEYTLPGITDNTQSNKPRSHCQANSLKVLKLKGQAISLYHFYTAAKLRTDV